MTNITSSPSLTHSFASLEADGWSRWDGEGFINLVGPFWTKGMGDAIIFGFLAEQRHHNRRGILQGGMMATFLDHALGRYCRQDDLSRRQATVQLDVHYMDATQIGEFIVARCEVVRRTRSLVFVRGVVTAGDRPVASAAGIWKILEAT